MISANLKTTLKHIVEKNQTNTASVTLYPHAQAILETFKSTQKIFQASNMRGHLKTHCAEKSNRCSHCDFEVPDFPDFISKIVAAEIINGAAEAKFYNFEQFFLFKIVNA